MKDIEDMLREMGLASWEELFSDVPKELWVERLDLPDGVSEWELLREVREVLGKNRDATRMPIFLGAGVYVHYIPSAVFAIASRSEFYTSYTPYQAEITQGMLQVLFEYQSVMAELTGMEVANSSMYDASTALGEAARMAHAVTGKREILVPEAMLWEKRSVLQNYVKGIGMRVRSYPHDPKTGMADLDAVAELINEDTAAIYGEVPNFFGVIDENVMRFGEMKGRALFIGGVNPVSLGVIKPPGDYGADIVVGEGQVLGNPPGFGGPLLGVFATRKKYVRRMPGRLIGATVDKSGRRAFVMTLQTREQHIRRGRATSNICSNEALCALMTVAYVAVLGRSGLRRLGEINMANAQRVMKALSSLPGFRAPHFQAHHFNEFVVDLPIPAREINEHLLKRGIQGGLPLDGCHGLGNSMLMAVTEVIADEDVEALISALQEVV